MIGNRCFIFCLLFGCCHQLYGQQTLSGKVYEAFTDSVLSGVNILNLQTGGSVRSAADGAYRINASEGNQIIFSGSGFRTDTINVSFTLLLTSFDVSLHRQVVSLKEVKITGSYRLDSLNRRLFYKNIHENKPGVTGHNRPADGVGVVLSPLSFLSKESKQKRALRKRVEKQEQEYYIDHSFPVAWVQTVTGLSGDSLSLFMYRYRPSYKFCRKTGREGMLQYINEKLKEFRNVKRS